MRDIIRLVCTEKGHNKWYEMEEKDHGKSFEVRYGKIGTTGQTGAYNIGMWEKKLREKLAKGYVQVQTYQQKISFLDIFAELDKKLDDLEKHMKQKELVK